jgi:hypothetical protein
MPSSVMFANDLFVNNWELFAWWQPHFFFDVGDITGEMVENHKYVVGVIHLFGLLNTIFLSLSHKMTQGLCQFVHLCIFNSFFSRFHDQGPQ